MFFSPNTDWTKFFVLRSARNILRELYFRILIWMLFIFYFITSFKPIYPHFLVIYRRSPFLCFLFHIKHCLSFFPWGFCNHQKHFSTGLFILFILLQDYIYELKFLFCLSNGWKFDQKFLKSFQKNMYFKDICNLIYIVEWLNSLKNWVNFIDKRLSY